jgi:hypothetical protein
MLPETCAFIFSTRKSLQGIFLKTHLKNTKMYVPRALMKTSFVLLTVGKESQNAQP